MINLDQLIENVSSAVTELQNALQDSTEVLTVQDGTRAEHLLGETIDELQFCLDEFEMSSNWREIGHDWLYFYQEDGKVFQLDRETLDWNDMRRCQTDASTEVVLDKLVIVEDEEIGVTPDSNIKYIDFSMCRKELVGWLIYDSKQINWTKK